MNRVRVTVRVRLRVIESSEYQTFTLSTRNPVNRPSYSCARAGGQECCDRIYLTAYLSAQIALGPHVRTLRDFLRMLPVAVARSSAGRVAICYVLPVSRMTSRLPVMGHMAQATQVRRKLKLTHRVAAPDQAAPDLQWA